MACQAPLAACVEFDGGNPTPIEQVEHIAGPVLGCYGGGRITASTRLLTSLSRPCPLIKNILKCASIQARPHAFFNNDTRSSTYREGVGPGSAFLPKDPIGWLMICFFCGGPLNLRPITRRLPPCRYRHPQR